MAKQAQEDLSDNELDAFDAGREKVLLDEAGEYLNREQNSDYDSEEEVLAFKKRDLSEDENSEEEEQEEDGDESDEEGWGTKKNYYGGDDVSDDEAGKEMAEEALRQQKKHLQDLDMDDFVDEDMMADWKKAEETEKALQKSELVVQEETADLDNLDDDEKLNYLAGSFPEFVPLLKEFSSLAPKLESFQSERANPLLQAKAVALSAYMSSISSYFAIFTENLRSQERFGSMKEDPVMESILSSREVWRQANELSLHMDVDEIEEEVAESEEEEIEEEAERVQTDSEEEEVSEQEESEEEAEIDITAKRAIRKAPKAAASGDFTETATPEAVDKEEKERRKKSLRFYTSKIDQAAKKSDRSDKFTGDLDIPYKERLFERQQRLIEEARKRGLGLDKAQLGDDLDSNDVGSADESTAREINEDAEDYYERIKNAKSAKKDARRAAHDDAKKAARDGKLAELQENTGEDGKRALNFQILKNKGLTPHRRNENRNARVKKRKKYEEAKKKLKSVRQVYDESNRGPYQGEKTGIKKGLSRSVKLV